MARTFSTIGAAAVLDNLFRIQEAMVHYAQDPDLTQLEVIDEDGMIVAALQPNKIGMEIQEKGWREAALVDEEMIAVEHSINQKERLVVVKPLWDQDRIVAWVRVGFSFDRVQQEEQRIMATLMAFALLLIGISALGIRISFRQMLPVLQGVVTKLEKVGAETEERLGERGFSNQFPLPYSQSEGVVGEIEKLADVANQSVDLLGMPNLGT